MTTTAIQSYGLPRPPASRGTALAAVNPARPFHYAAEASTSMRTSICGPRIATGIPPLLSAVPARPPATEVSYVKVPPPRRVPSRPVPFETA